MVSRRCEQCDSRTLTPGCVCDDSMTAETYACLRINAPHWYARADFLAWLNSRGVATWHKPGSVATEYSDVFVTIDGDEGSDANGGNGSDSLPDDIWQAIVTAARRLGVRDGIVWISNIER